MKNYLILESYLLQYFCNKNLKKNFLIYLTVEKSFFQSRHDANPVVKFRRDDIKEFSIVLSKQSKFLIAEKNYE